MFAHFLHFSFIFFNIYKNMFAVCRSFDFFRTSIGRMISQIDHFDRGIFLKSVHDIGANEQQTEQNSCQLLTVWQRSRNRKFILNVG